MDYVWIEEGTDFKKINNTEMVVYVKWTLNPSEDYLELSRQYFQSGYIVLKKVYK